jgi:hypothetical protein
MFRFVPKIQIKNLRAAQLLLVSSITFLSSCGFSDQERKAAEIACECSKVQLIEGVRDCIRDAADSLKIDVGAYSYDRAFKEVCPDTYKRIMDFSKGKTKGKDEAPVAGN